MTGLAVQHFASIIPQLLECFNAEETTEIVVDFCDTIVSTKGAIAVHKVLLQHQLINGPLFQDTGARASLVPNICRWLKPHLGRLDDAQAYDHRESVSSKDAAKVSWLECTRLSVAAVAGLVDKLHENIVDPSVVGNSHLLGQEQDNIEFVLSLLPRLTETYIEADALEVRQVLGRHRSAATVVQAEPYVFPSSHPAPLLLQAPPSYVQQGIQQLVAVRGEAAAVIIALVHIAPPNVLLNYLQGCVEVEGFSVFSRFLSNFLQVCCSFLRCEAFPATWLNISMLAHKSIVKIARPIATVMQEYFIPDKHDAANFDVELWRSFFDVMLKLLSSPSLVIEEFLPARQRAVWRLAGDIRGEGSKVLLWAWQALSWPDKAGASKIGGYQAGLGNIVSVYSICEA